MRRYLTTTVTMVTTTQMDPLQNLMLQLHVVTCQINSVQNLGRRQSLWCPPSWINYLQKLKNLMLMSTKHLLPLFQDLKVE